MTRVVVTIPVDIPAISARVRMEIALLLSVIEEQFPALTVSSTPSTSVQNLWYKIKILIID